MSDDLKRSSVLDGADLVLPSAPKAPPEPKTLDEALDQLAYGANASAEAQPVKCPACDGHEVVRYDGYDSEGWAKEGPCPLCCVPSAAREAKPVAKHATGPDGTCEPCPGILGIVQPGALSHDFTPAAHRMPATESFLRQIATENEKENERVRDELAKSAAESDAIASALRTQIAALEGQLAATRAVLRQFSAWTHMVPGPSETVTTCGIDTIGTDIKSAVVRAMVTCPICLRVPAPGQLTPAELLLSRGAEQAKKLAADRLVSNDFLHRSLGDILRGVGVEPHSNPGELVAQIAGLVKPKKLPWEAGNKHLKPGVTGPHEIRKVAPGAIVETANGYFAVKIQAANVPGCVGSGQSDCLVCWLSDGTIGIVPAMSSVMMRPVPGEEDADGAARDKANREHWASSGLPGPYIEDAEDRTNYLLNEYDRLSAWARGASQRVERMREAAAELAESCSGGDHQISQRNLIAQRIRRLTEQDTDSGTTIAAGTVPQSGAALVTEGGARKERNRTYMIGVDIGGVISKYPDIMLPIMRALSAGGVEVHVVTDIPIKKALTMLALNGVDVPASRVHSCDYEAHGDACKAVKARELGLDMLWDDCIGYVSNGAPPVRMLVMPDGDRDYYHPSWKTDGTEGKFGRRLQRTNAAESQKDMSPKPSWLVPWEGLTEPDREVDRRIGEAVARAALGAQSAPAMAAELAREMEPECTGTTAVWCPLHGDCTCPYLYDNPDEGRTLDAPDCPLHGDKSEHAPADDEPAPPRALTEAEAQRWAEDYTTTSGGKASEVKAMLLAASRGDVPPGIRAAATPLDLSALAATVPPDVMAAARAEARAEYGRRPVPGDGGESAASPVPLSVANAARGGAGTQKASK